MRILLIKTSSLGDVFHTFPALTDARAHIPDLRVDWVVEEAFAEIPTWHPAVNKVIPVAWRRWRKNLGKVITWREMKQFRDQLQSGKYDLVLDAQGLIKSAIITRLAKGPRYGLDKHSAREPLASRAYDKTIEVAKGEHAIHRLRKLFAQCLGYATPNSPINYGIDSSRWPKPEIDQPYIVFIHGSAWDTKLWPEQYWNELCGIIGNAGYKVVLPWGNESEQRRANRIAAQHKHAWVPERLPLAEVARLLAHSTAIIGVDTGLSHVAAALDVPTVVIYGATDASLTGALGNKTTIQTSTLNCSPCLSRKCRLMANHKHLYPPCYEEISPKSIWDILQTQSNTTENCVAG